MRPLPQEAPLFQKGEANALLLAEAPAPGRRPIELSVTSSPLSVTTDSPCRSAGGRVGSPRHLGAEGQHPPSAPSAGQPVADNALAAAVVTHRLAQWAGAD